MTSIISAVPKEEIGKVWPIVRPMLDKAITRTHGRWHSVDVMTELLQGKASLWVALDEKRQIMAALTLTIFAYPSGLLAGRITFAGGHDRDEWAFEIWDTVERYCIAQGCDFLEGNCRNGVLPYVEKYGAKGSATFFEKNLRKSDP